MSLTRPTQTDDSGEQTTLTDTSELREARVEAQRERALDVDESPYASSESSVVRRPNDGINTTCQYCENVVSTKFVRIFGSDNGTIHCCPDCATFRELQDGAAATPGYEPDGESGEVNW